MVCEVAIKTALWCFLILLVKLAIGLTAITQDQTSSRPNTLLDDADDIQRQLDNEARDKFSLGQPNTIWVFKFPTTEIPKQKSYGRSKRRVKYLFKNSPRFHKETNHLYQTSSEPPCEPECPSTSPPPCEPSQPCEPSKPCQPSEPSKPVCEGITSHLSKRRSQNYNKFPQRFNKKSRKRYRALSPPHTCPPPPSPKPPPPPPPPPPCKPCKPCEPKAPEPSKPTCEGITSQKHKSHPRISKDISSKIRRHLFQKLLSPPCRECPPLPPSKPSPMPPAPPPCKSCEPKKPPCEPSKPKCEGFNHQNRFKKNPFKKPRKLFRTLIQLLPPYEPREPRKRQLPTRYRRSTRILNKSVMVSKEMHRVLSSPSRKRECPLPPLPPPQPASKPCEPPPPPVKSPPGDCSLTPQEPPAPACKLPSPSHKPPPLPSPPLPNYPSDTAPDTCEWAYRGKVISIKKCMKADQAKWGEKYSQCRGRSQSPVDLPVVGLLKAKPGRKLVFANYDVCPESMMYQSDGQRIMIFGEWPKRKRPLVYGGAAHSRRYVFYGLFLHWPSEHSVGGLQYPIEVQVLHYSAEYSSFKQALDASSSDPQAFLCIANIYKFGTTTQKGLGEIVKAIQNKTQFSIDKSIPCFAMKDLNPPFGTYVTYQGSLPFPPCTEAVLWFVRGKALPVSREIVATVNAMGKEDTCEKKVVNRDIQPLNDRKVFWFDC